MDSKKMMFIGLTLLGLFVIIDSIWFILNPPYGDEPQGYAFIAIGFFIILIGYTLTFGKRKFT